ncbi:hypothetical protein ANN_16960 [Periplaneta americana]|uniref:Reverse transcriptase domain-containing protein n=1 Tax=Periplaneta americana TaxID=6978 RepID=A0ABQ8SRK5_PERAM|nr:hypothetical protein ANN_16960 [Periplaneta americana]
MRDLASIVSALDLLHLRREQLEWRCDATTNIKLRNKHSLARTEIKYKVSTEFRITKGLRQVFCLSPTLFKIYLEEVLKGWKKKCRHMGVLVGDKNISTLQFVDDQIILAEDYDDIEYMSRKLIEEYEKSGLKFNFENLII